MEYITTKEASEKWGISPTRITILANQGRIMGARRVGKSWLIPGGAEKPAPLHGGRAASSAEKCEADNFSFPLYIFRPDWSPELEKKLTGQEKLLLSAVKCVQECRFQEAYTMVEPVLSNPSGIGMEIGALYLAGICATMLNRVYDFSQFYLRLQMMLSSDFPHRDDYAVLLDDLKTYVKSAASIAYAQTINSDIHEQCIPMLCMKIGYVYMSRETASPGSTEVELLELAARFLGTTGAAAAVEHLQIYLTGIYYLRNDLAAAEKHARTAIRIAYENGHCFSLVLCYRYYESVMAPILAEYPQQFRQQLLALSSQYARNMHAFLAAVSEDAVFSKLTDGEFPYAYAVLQELPNKEIARRLHVSENTVRRRLEQVCAKLGVRTKKELRDTLRQNATFAAAFSE